LVIISEWMVRERGKIFRIMANKLDSRLLGKSRTLMSIRNCFLIYNFRLPSRW